MYIEDYDWAIEFSGKKRLLRSLDDLPNSTVEYSFFSIYKSGKLRIRIRYQWNIQFYNKLGTLKRLDYRGRNCSVTAKQAILNNLKHLGETPDWVKK